METSLYRSLFDEFPAALLVVDRDGRILAANRAAADLPTGAGGDLQGADFFQVFEDLEDLQEIRDRFLVSQKSGPVRLCFDTGLRNHGSPRLPLQVRMHGIDGAVLVVVELVQAGEGNRSAALLLRNSVKQLSDIRHDINNPLMGILGHAELLRGRKDLGPDAANSVDTIMEQCLKIRDLVQELGRVRDSLRKK